MEGWAIDPDSTASVPVVIYIDGPGGGVVAGVFNADLSRPDLAATYPQAGPNHGFDRNGPSDIYPPEPDLWPWAPLPGDFDVCAWASNLGAGAHNVEIGCGHLHIAY